jgi:TonB-dependent receptor-like protein/carboxypeptidase family protein
MTGISRLMASAALCGLALLGKTVDARADGPALPGSRLAPVAPGSIHGIVQDHDGTPISGAIVSAFGTTTTYAVTDRSGRFELRPLSPGAYLIRAHSKGFIVSHSQTVDVRAAGRTLSVIALQRVAVVTASAASSARTTTETESGNREAAKAAPAPILQAGLTLPLAVAGPESSEVRSQPADKSATSTDSSQTDEGAGSELMWRLRHLRRSVLQETDDVFDPMGSLPLDPDMFNQAPGFARADNSPLKLAANFFGGAPFTGEVNFLTTSSFDSPQQLFNGDMSARSVAYMSVGAPAGSNVDWSVRGALSQADISAWVIAGTYSNRAPSRHQYDVGLSYATQRYDGGNPAALRDVTDGSRNAGAMYGFDTWTLSPAFAVTYGTRYARYDYLEHKNLISPRASMTVSAGDSLRVTTSASRRSVAPGAEEFLPPGESGIWLPPQRTFSSFASNGQLDAERTTNIEVDVERDLGSSSAVSFRAFRQYVAGQLATMFGLEMPGAPPSNLGHYFVGNVGDVEARGIAAGIRTATRRLHGSIDYSMTRADWSNSDDVGFLLLRMPGALLRPDHLHSLSTSIQTDVPETSTRVVVLYRISSAMASRAAAEDRTIDSRFDIEVHQSLPFMDFSTAKWEMLIGVRNFFRETATDQSVFDELLVVRPPKRIVGGITMRF